MRLALLAAFIVGCASPADDAARCGPTTTEHGELCVPNVDACEGAQRSLPGGGCVAVGVPEGGCGEGFSWSNGACSAVLPKERCADGQLAIPGETSCRPVQTCGDDTYGDIPVTPGMLFVDASSTAGASDGTREHPFTTVDAAIAAASNGSAIAVAAGTYKADLSIRKSVKLWGRCPQMVTLEGVSDATLACAVSIEGRSVELHGLAVRGPGCGVTVLYTSGDTLLDRVWIHDTGERGVRIEGSSRSPANVVVRGSLFERASVAALGVTGGTLTVEASVLRDGVTHPTYGFGGGILVDNQSDFLSPATLTMRRTLVERMKSLGVAVLDSHATVEDSVLRDIVTEEGRTDAGGSPAFDVQRSKKSPLTPTLNLDRVVAERMEGGGIALVGAIGAMRNVTVREPLTVRTDGALGTGIELSGAAELTLEDSAVVSFAAQGMLVSGSTASITRALISDGAGTAKGEGGAGLLVVPAKTTAMRSNLTLLESLVARTHGAGVYIAGSDARVEDVDIRDVLPETSSRSFGDGIGIAAWGDEADGTFQQGVLTLRRAIIRRAARAAANVAAGSLTLQDSLLTCSAFEVEVDRNYGGTSAKKAADFTLVDDGGNYCGCGSTFAKCRARSSSLSPYTTP